MNNITLITSIIDTCKNPLSYSNIRSYWTKEERYEHTKKTIESVKKFIPNNKILLVECSLLNDDEINYFLDNTDFFLNLYDLNDAKITNYINSNSKSMGEGTMTIQGLEYLFKNNIKFDNLFKISGRYWLNNNFNYLFYDNEYNCICKIHDMSNVFTCIYKLTNKTTIDWLHYLKKSENDFINCIGYEKIFGSFLINYNNNTYKIIERPIGINGYISISNEYIDV